MKRKAVYLFQSALHQCCRRRFEGQQIACGLVKSRFGHATRFARDQTGCDKKPLLSSGTYQPRPGPFFRHGSGVLAANGTLLVGLGRSDRLPLLFQATLRACSLDRRCFISLCCPRSLISGETLRIEDHTSSVVTANCPAALTRCHVSPQATPPQIGGKSRLDAGATGES